MTKNDSFNINTKESRNEAFTEALHKEGDNMCVDRIHSPNIHYREDEE